MLQAILLPQLGQTMEEGKIEKWHKSEGDRVQKGEILYELTTDKATLEVESFASGVLKKVLVAEGETVPVNVLIAIIGEEADELPQDLDAYRAEVTSQAQEEGAAAATPAEAGARPQAAAAAPAGTAAAPPGPPARIFASPRARRIAEEQKVPLAVLRGSGPEGRIVERDVLEYAQKLSQIRCTPTARELACQAGVDLLSVRPAEPGARITRDDVEKAARQGAAPGRPGRRLALSAMRQTIARRMAQSKQTLPHFYLIGEVLMRKALQRRQELNASGEAHITVTDVLVKAAGLALKAHPRMNARFEGDSVVLNEEANVGVAVAVEDGLFVPVLKNADARTLQDISAELKALAKTAREGKLRPDQYEGGSITISNLGPFGVDSFLPIINPPEACIIGVGRAAEQPVVKDGAICVEPVMSISISADHRVVDGAEAGRFFQTFKQLLEEPEGL